MEKQIITKTTFQKLLRSIGDETYEIVLEGLNWYEQLTDGETVYQYKLMSLQEQDFSDFWKKAQFPGKLISEGKVYAYAYIDGNTIKYYLVPEKVLESEIRKAREMVMNYARCIVGMKSSRPPRITITVREEASK
jgi:hypothetical protein